MASLVVMHAWSKFTFYLWSFFSLKIHETCLPILSYRNLITKSKCQWFFIWFSTFKHIWLSSIQVSTYLIMKFLKFSCFNLFGYLFMVVNFKLFWLFHYFVSWWIGFEISNWLLIWFFKYLVFKFVFSWFFTSLNVKFQTNTNLPNDLWAYS